MLSSSLKWKAIRIKCFIESLLRCAIIQSIHRRNQLENRNCLKPLTQLWSCWQFITWLRRAYSHGDWDRFTRRSRRCWRASKVSCSWRILTDPVMVSVWSIYLFFRKLSKIFHVSGITAALATSDLCVNSSEATVNDCFWSNDISQGISVTPKQLIFLNPFITFPTSPGFVPFKFACHEAPDTTADDVIYTLIETDLLPPTSQSSSLEVLNVKIFWVREP